MTQEREAPGSIWNRSCTGVNGRADSCSERSLVVKSDGCGGHSATGCGKPETMKCQGKFSGARGALAT